METPEEEWMLNSDANFDTDIGIDVDDGLDWTDGGEEDDFGYLDDYGGYGTKGEGAKCYIFRETLSSAFR
jgi:hypothetical protein